MQQFFQINTSRTECTRSSQDQVKLQTHVYKLASLEMKYEAIACSACFYNAAKDGSSVRCTWHCHLTRNL